MSGRSVIVLWGLVGLMTGGCGPASRRAAGAGVGSGGVASVETYTAPAGTTTHTWSVDGQHVLHFDGAPYVPFMTSHELPYANGAAENLQEWLDRDVYPTAALGIREFMLEVGDGPEDASLGRFDFLDQLTDAIIVAGGTYSVRTVPTAYLHSRAAQVALGPADRAPFYVRAVVDVSPVTSAVVVSFAGTALDMRAAMATQDALETTGVTFQGETQAYLVDLSADTCTDVSTSVASARYDDATAEVTVLLDPIPLPASASLKLVVLARVLATTIMKPGGGDAVAVVSADAIVAAHAGFYAKFRDAVAKDELRVVTLYNEIDGLEENFHFFTGTEFPDFSQDVDDYRRWLEAEYGRIEDLNGALSTSYGGFEEVPWLAPLVFDETALLGVFDSKSQALAVEALQRDYFTHRMGHGLAAVADVVRREWGNPPVGMEATEAADLDLQEAALEAGLDGIGVHYYSSLANLATRADLANALAVLDRQAHGTFYWVTEFLEVVPGETTPPARTREEYLALPYNHHFQSKSDLEQYLRVLTDNGLKGFNLWTAIGKQDPLAVDDTRRWYSELKAEVVSAAAQ